MVAHDWGILLGKASGLAPSIGVSVVVLAGVLFFSPRPHVLLTTICLFSIVWDAWGTWRRQEKPTLSRILKIQAGIILWVVFVVWLDGLLGGWGILGLLLTSTVIAGFILYRRRKQYLDAMRGVERIIWGKALDEKKEEKP